MAIDKSNLSNNFKTLKKLALEDNDSRALDLTFDACVEELCNTGAGLKSATDAVVVFLRDVERGVV